MAADTVSSESYRGPLFIEFVGLPGSGKSTVAAEVVARLQSEGYRSQIRPPLFRDRQRGIVHRIRFLYFRLTSWRLAFALLAFTVSVRPRRSSRLPHLRQLLFLAYYLREKRNDDLDVVILDQSILQALWGSVVPSEAFSRSRLTRLARLLYKDHPGLVSFVYFPMEPALAASRVVARGTPGNRFDMLSPEAAEELFRRYQPELVAIMTLGAEAADATPVAIAEAGVNERAASVTRVVLDALWQHRRVATPSCPPSPAGSMSRNDAGEDRARK
jgi:hypothetical protein